MDPRISDSRIRLVSGDTGPQIRLTLTDEVVGAPVDLTGAAASLHFKSSLAGTVLFSRALTIPAATASSGVAIVVWGITDLTRPAGDYEGEIEVLFPSGVRQTVYDTLKFRLREQFA